MVNSHVLCEDCKVLCKCGSYVTRQPCELTLKLVETLPSFCCFYKNGCKVSNTRTVSMALSKAFHCFTEL